MKYLQKLAKHKLNIVGFVLVTAGMLAIGCFCPLVFGFNDDTMMRSILSGDYLGSPDGHAVYMRYPLTGILSMLYGLTDAIPWFSLFYGACMAVCVFVVLSQVGKSVRGMTYQTLAVLFAAEILLLLLFGHFVVMHYTIVAALLGGTAVFLLVSKENAEKMPKGSVAVSLILLYLCYMVRSQVFFMALPFLLVALLWQVALLPMGGSVKKRFIHCGRYVGVLALGIVLFLSLHKLMYAGEEWQKYEVYNDARTELYDYSGILSYEDYREVYEEIGLSKEQYQLLESYNIVLDDSLSAGQLTQLAQAAEDAKAGMITDKELFVKRFGEYYYRTFHEQDFPYNLVVILLYTAVAVFCLYKKQWLRMVLLMFTGCGRSIIWLYLMVKGRYPERVTDSLYLIESLLLAGICLQYIREISRAKSHFALAGMSAIKSRSTYKRLQKPGSIVLLTAGILLFVPSMLDEVERGFSEAVIKEQAWQEWAELESYMSERQDDFFYVDVYSTVAVSGMQYEKSEYENYMLLGGWMTKSALQEEKQLQTGYVSAVQALAEGENICLVMHADRDLQYLEAYFASAGYPVQFNLQEQVGDFCIYAGAVLQKNE